MSGNQHIIDQSTFPTPEALRHGDLIWCRAKFSVLLRDVDTAAAPMNLDEPDYARYGPTTHADWIAERDAFIANAKAREDAESIKKMELGEFLDRYQGQSSVETTEDQQRRGLSSQTLISTGHVAMIAVDATGQRLVMEAGRPTLEPPPTYAVWLTRFRRPFFVWQGRLNVDDASLPAAAADTARRWLEREYVGRPFSLWNFDLDDPSAFYCAKFVWMAVYRASERRLSLDGKPDAKRGFLEWCTPLSLMRSRHVALTFDPATYGLIDALRPPDDQPPGQWTPRQGRA